MSFTDLGLSPETLQAIEEVGYTSPTPIQEQAIPFVLMGRDVLGIAQTGTGKTASFTLPMIDILAQGQAKARMPRSLILAPTRELANQVAENFTLYGKYQKLSMALLIGGESFTEQEKALDRGVDVLIATPGRLLDLFGRGRILLRDVKILVIDEADRMLDMGFIPDVEKIVSLLPPLRQTLFFSATMDGPIRKLTEAFLSNPKMVRVSSGASAATTVTQHLVVVDEQDKREALRHILRMEDVRNAFIFCNRKRDVGVLFRSLKKHGFDVAQMHGDMQQSERTATLAQFKGNSVSLLVCSDVAARGIDIADVSHVFNFDVPIHSEDYVHRIGRTGRAGREGRAWTIAVPGDIKSVAAIEKLIGTAIPRVDLEGIESQELSEDAARDARKKRRDGGRDSSSRDGSGREGSGREGGSRDSERRRSRDDRRDSRSSEARNEPATVDSSEADTSRNETPRNDERRTDERRPEDRRPEDRKGGDDRKMDDRRKRAAARPGRRGHPAWEVEEMEHADDVLAFGTHIPAFMLAVVEPPPLREDDDSDNDIAPLEAAIEEIDDVPDSPADDTPRQDDEAGTAEEGTAETSTGSRRRSSRRRVVGRRRRSAGDAPLAADATDGESGEDETGTLAQDNQPPVTDAHSAKADQGSTGEPYAAAEAATEAGDIPETAVTETPDAEAPVTGIADMAEPAAGQAGAPVPGDAAETGEAIVAGTPEAATDPARASIVSPPRRAVRRRTKSASAPVEATGGSSADETADDAASHMVADVSVAEDSAVDAAASSGDEVPLARPKRKRVSKARATEDGATEDGVAETAGTTEEAPAPRKRTRSRKAATGVSATEDTAVVETEAPVKKKRASRKTTAKADVAVDSEDAANATTEAPARPKRRRTTKATAPAADAPTAETGDSPAPANGEDDA